MPATQSRDPPPGSPPRDMPLVISISLLDVDKSYMFEVLQNALFNSSKEIDQFLSQHVSSRFVDQLKVNKFLVPFPLVRGWFLDPPPPPKPHDLTCRVR